jgi:hypothetical protein
METFLVFYSPILVLVAFFAIGNFWPNPILISAEKALGLIIVIFQFFYSVLEFLVILRKGADPDSGFIFERIILYSIFYGVLFYFLVRFLKGRSSYKIFFGISLMVLGIINYYFYHYLPGFLIVSPFLVLGALYFIADKKGVILTEATKKIFSRILPYFPKALYFLPIVSIVVGIIMYNTESGLGALVGILYIFLAIPLFCIAASVTLFKGHKTSSRGKKIFAGLTLGVSVISPIMGYIGLQSGSDAIALISLILPPLFVIISFLSLILKRKE